MPSRPIYITSHLDDKLRKEENMSGLVNRLLANHYASQGDVFTHDEKMKEAQKTKLEELAQETGMQFASEIREQTVVPVEETA